MVVISRKQSEAVCFHAFDAQGKPLVIEVEMLKAPSRVKLGLTMPECVRFRRKELPEFPETKEEAA